MPAEPLIEAAGLVADGLVPDWGSTSSRLSSDEERALADELALLAKIAEEHRRLHQLRPAPAGVPTTVNRSSWGHLDLLEVVGHGSYGTVYRAWDGRLDRQVALKLFHDPRDPEAVMREGRMLARIRHDNVVSVYGADVVDGVAGIWMEFVRGRSLDQIVREQGPLSAQEATLVGLDMARALAAVHAAGLLHCDVKAHNVIREPGGRLVLMDLGAARVAPLPDDESKPTHLSGTPRYMAPELFNQVSASPQSDLYSLGVLLFYLVTGSYPVDGKSLTEIRTAHADGLRRHLRDLRPELPTGYLREVQRALESDPRARHRSAGEFEAGLLSLSTLSIPSLVYESQQTSARRSATTRWLLPSVAAVVAVALSAAAVWQWNRPNAPASTETARSIAVLPIRNLTGDPSKDYLANGLTEVLISNLARVRAFHVPSFGAVAPYRGVEASAAKVAEPLGVELLLAGSIVEASDRARIEFHLIDRGDRVVWSKDLVSGMADVLGAQAEIARLVASHLSVALSPAERQVLTSQTIDPRAQEAYLRGVVEAASASDAQMPLAVEHFRLATDIEPKLAPAWAGRSMAELWLAQFAGSEVQARRVNDARAFAERALGLDAGSPEALVALATVQFYYEWEFDAAESTLRRAREAAPSNTLVMNHLANLLAARRQLNEAVALAQQAVALEPTVALRLTTLGLMYYYQRDYQRATGMMEASLKIAPEHPVALYHLGRIFAAQRNYSAAVAYIQRALAQSRNMAWLPELACILAATGDTEGVNDVLKELAERERRGETYSVDHRAHVAAAEGRLDEGIDILRKAIESRAPSVLWMGVDPRLDPYRSDPRFDQLLRQANLHE